MLHGRRLPRGTRIGGAAAVLGLVAAVSVNLASPLNGNLRYEVGVKRAGTFSAAETFSHRPLAFRLLMDGVFRAADLVSVGPVSFEFVVRLLALIGLAGAAWVLARGLRARLVPHPVEHAAVAAGAVLLISPINTGEPDWMAVVLTAAGVGVALIGRRRLWWWALLSAPLFVGATWMKLVTVATALIGLGAVALIDRRQAARALVATVAVGAAYVLVTLIWFPWELQWLFDLRTVQNDPVVELPEAGPYFATLIAYRPALLLVPAALVLAGARERIAVVIALGIAIAAVVGQGQYFVYHAVPLVVIAALAVFRALRGRLTTPIALGIALLVAGSALLTGRSGTWLADHTRGWVGAMAGVVLVSILWALRQRRSAAPPTPRRGPACAALATLALLLPASTPPAAQFVRPMGPDGSRPSTTWEKRAESEATARRVRAIVGGPEVPVTYLTFGEWTYFIANPTDCRYPSPLFLQRTTRDLPRQSATRSYAEVLSCLRTPASRWLILDPVWFRLRNKPAIVQQAVAEEWDCTAGVDVAQLRLCPRRR